MHKRYSPQKDSTINRAITICFSLNIISVFLILISFDITRSSLWTWQQPDIFDVIDNQMRKVTSENCRSKHHAEMYLPAEVVSQLPRYNKLRDHVYYKNRTTLVHLHNSALNRAYFHSFVLQRFNRSKHDFGQLPDWLHMYFGVAADINSNPSVINGSGLYFDNHCYYPNWINGLAFNRTLPLFAPVAWRYDDYKDSRNFLREPTLRSVKVMDWGAGRGNYTHIHNRMNPWYNLWQMPDLKSDHDSLTKFTYFIGIKYSDTPGRFTSADFQTSVFYGPSQPGQNAGEEELPVKFTQPYFDCGKSNQWIVSAVAPVIDYMDRYSSFSHIRRPRIVALISMDTYFRKIDFNACPVSTGNPGPSLLSGIDRCKKSTQCKHVSGFGFKRGGYRCTCRSGYRYPYHIDPPFRGSVIEKATGTEYEKDFQCFPIHRKMVHVVQHESTLWDPYKLPNYQDPPELFPSSKPKRKKLQPSDTSPVITDDLDKKNQTTYTNPSKEPSNTAESSQTPKVSVDQISQNGRPNVEQTPNSFYSESEADSNGSGSNKNNGKLNEKMITKKEIKAGLDSEKVLEQITKNKIPKRIVARYRDRQPETYNESPANRARFLFDKIQSVNKSNCWHRPKSDLIMPGSVSHGVESQFEPQARTALRLAQFLSNYYQNAESGENFGILKGGKPLHQDLLFGEVLANVMADHRILSSGIFFDEYQFRRGDGSFKKLFGPWAFRNATGFWALDASGLPESYTKEIWFKVAKHRYKTSASGLERYWLKPHVRIDVQGSGNVKFKYHSISYRAPKLSSGQWHQPKYRCDGRIDDWIISFTVPFFGSNKIHHRLQFLGVVMVDVPLLLLEINECPQPFYVSNAFKNTAKCPESTKCSPLPGFRFTLGSYACKCKQGYEYAFQDGRAWIQGFTLEQEWKKKSNKLNNRFDLLTCRVSAGSRFQLYTGYLPIILYLLLFQS